MGFAGWLNWAWMLSRRGNLAAFHRATRDVAGSQAAKLRRILAANVDTAFGRRHGFASIRNVHDFQARAPLADYEAMAPWIERIARGEDHVLTGEPVRLLEPTGGSTDGEKLIPYTNALRADFQFALGAWIADLFMHRPGARAGRAYWSLSPAFGAERRSIGGIPIGFDSDAAYLGRAEQLLLRHVLVAPPEIARIDRIEAFRHATLAHLLAAADLSLISIWHPSFLTRLVASLDAWGERICTEIEHGAIYLTGVGAPRLAGDRRRADQVRRVLRELSSPHERFAALWPKLALISCWTDAAAAIPTAELRQLFPAVEFQSKGLVATEGIVSFPLVGQPAPPLALESHFFEFLEGNPSTNSVSRLAHELEPGGRYRVVLTTSGGMYRYTLHDEVEVVGFLRECPLIRFRGKLDRTSDLVGEKLSEVHVQAAVTHVLSKYRIHATFALLAPMEGQPPHYRLFLQCGSSRPEPLLERLRSALDAELAKNPHYRYAIGLGQLAPADVQWLSAEALLRRFSRRAPSRAASEWAPSSQLRSMPGPAGPNCSARARYPAIFRGAINGIVARPARGNKLSSPRMRRVACRRAHQADSAGA